MSIKDLFLAWEPPVESELKVCARALPPTPIGIDFNLITKEATFSPTSFNHTKILFLVKLIIRELKKQVAQTQRKITNRSRVIRRICICQAI